jgi:hypothetical protein
MFVAGIDYSTKAVDVVLIDEDAVGAPEWHRFPLGGLGDGFDRARTVRAAMPSRGWWEDKGVIAVGIEDPRGYGAGFLYRVQGGILQCLPRDVLVQPWIPSAWRSRCDLPGNCSKQAVANRVGLWVPSAADWPWDACDAYCIARATRDSLEREAA